VLKKSHQDIINYGAEVDAVIADHKSLKRSLPKKTDDRRKNIKANPTQNEDFKKELDEVLRNPPKSNRLYRSENTVSEETKRDFEARFQVPHQLINTNKQLQNEVERMKAENQRQEALNAKLVNDVQNKNIEYEQQIRAMQDRIKSLSENTNVVEAKHEVR